MHEVSDMSYDIDLRCGYQMTICWNFSLLKLSIADPFIFIVTGL